MMSLRTRQRAVSGLMGVLVALMASVAPMLGCGDTPRMPPPPVDDTRGGVSEGYGPSSYDQTAQAKPGMSTKKKLVILAGAAALYYLYKKHQNAQAQSGPEGQYYLSKNGRVYYRDAEHRAHWVTPPPGGIQVPEQEAMDYQNMQGFQGRQDGQDMADIAAGLYPGAGG